MAKKKTKAPAAEGRRGRGRPRLADPNTMGMSLKVSAAFRAAAGRYRERHGLRTLSEAVRAAAERTFAADR